MQTTIYFPDTDEEKEVEVIANCHEGQRGNRQQPDIAPEIEITAVLCEGVDIVSTLDSGTLKGLENEIWSLRKNR